MMLLNLFFLFLGFFFLENKCFGMKNNTNEIQKTESEDSDQTEERIEEDEKVDENQFSYKCLKCNYKHSKKSTIKNHLIKRHYQSEEQGLEMIEKFAKNAPILYECPRCELSPKKLNVFKKHLKRTHRLSEEKILEIVLAINPAFQPRVRRSKDFFKCSECIHSSVDSTNLKKHLMSRHKKTEKQAIKKMIKSNPHYKPYKKTLDKIKKIKNSDN